MFYLFFSFPLLQFKVIVTRPGGELWPRKDMCKQNRPRRAPEDITWKTDKSYGRSQPPISMTGDLMRAVTFFCRELHIAKFNFYLRQNGMKKGHFLILLSCPRQCASSLSDIALHLHATKPPLPKLFIRESIGIWRAYKLSSGRHLNTTMFYWQFSERKLKNTLVA